MNTNRTENNLNRLSVIVLSFVILLILIIMIYQNLNKTGKNEIIEMDAVVSYSSDEYSSFTGPDFSGWVVYDEPLRDYYAPVTLRINTHGTNINTDDTVIEVLDRDINDINSTGGDIYEQY